MYTHEQSDEDSVDTNILLALSEFKKPGQG